MRIVYFLRDITDCGGIQQTTCNLINGLCKEHANYEITTISLYHKYPTPFFNLNPKVKNIALFDKKVDQRWSLFSIKKYLKKTLCSFSFDVMIVQGVLFSIYLPSYLWKKHNVVVCEHGHYSMGTAFGLHAFGRRIALKKAKVIVSLTNLDREEYKKHCKNGVYTRCIPNACNILDYEPIYNSESTTIVSVGTLDDIKQFDQAIDAASDVLAKHPGWEWHFFGDGPNRSELQAQIDRTNFSERIKLCGYENDKKIIYGDKSFLVLTSKYEGFGMVLLEALQHKLPVISYDVKYGPKEIVQNGFNGYLIVPNDIKELSCVISKFIENKPERVVLSKNSEKTVSCFSLTSVVAQWVKLFEELFTQEKTF